MTKNDNSDSSEDIKVGDRVFVNFSGSLRKVGMVKIIKQGWLFTKYFVIAETDLNRILEPGDLIRMYKKYRWQLFKIS